MTDPERITRALRLLRTKEGQDYADLILRNSQATAKLSAISAPYLLRGMYSGTGLNFVDNLHTQILSQPQPQLALVTGLPFSGKTDASNWISDVLSYRFGLTGQDLFIGRTSWDLVKKMIKDSGAQDLIDSNNRYTAAGMKEANNFLLQMIRQLRNTPNCMAVIVDTPLYYAEPNRTHAVSALKTAVQEDFGASNSHHLEVVVGVMLSQEIVARRDEPRSAGSVFEATQKRLSVDATPPLSTEDLEELTAGANQSIRDNSVAEAIAYLIEHPNLELQNQVKTLLATRDRPDIKAHLSMMYDQAWTILQNSMNPPTEQEVRHWTWLSTMGLPVVGHANMLQIGAKNRLVGYNEKPLKT